MAEDDDINIELSIDDIGGHSLDIIEDDIIDESIMDDDIIDDDIIDDDMSLDIIDVQSIDDDIIIEESIIDDELLWAKPGTTAAAIEPAAIKAASKAICFFMESSGGKYHLPKAVFSHAVSRDNIRRQTRRNGIGILTFARPPRANA